MPWLRRPRRQSRLPRPAERRPGEGKRRGRATRLAGAGGSRARRWLALPVGRAVLAAALPAQADAPFERGLALLKAGRALEAAEALESAAASRPSDPAVLYYLGNARLRAGDAERAFAVLERSVALAPDNAAAQLSLAQAAGALGEFGRAEAALDRAARLDPGRPRPVDERGRLALRRYQYGEAVREFARAVEAQPEDLDSLRGLAESLFLTRDLEGARAACERGLSVSPGDRALLAWRSRVLARLAGGEAAERAYRAALEAGADDTELHFEAGSVSLREGSFPAAVERLRRALEGDPAHGGAR
ncbi:MAG: tetratricopeptide repeat protein, partial [Planctomycetota bacterium]